jgi:hypothetical protein
MHDIASVFALIKRHEDLRATGHPVEQLTISEDGLQSLRSFSRKRYSWDLCPLIRLPPIPDRGRMSQIRSKCQFVQIFLLQSTSYPTLRSGTSPCPLPR